MNAASFLESGLMREWILKLRDATMAGCQRYRALGLPLQPAWIGLFLIVLSKAPIIAQTTEPISATIQPSVEIKNALVKISESVEVPVEVSGVLTKLAVAEGQMIAQGEVVAQIKNDVLTLKLERARMEHDLAKMAAESQVDVLYSQKSYDVAQSDVRRSEKANQRVPNSVPVAKLEKQQLERDRTQLKLEQAKRESKIAAFKTKLTSSDIKLAQLELNKSEVRAPMSGLVVAVEKRVGEWAESSEVVCRIVRTDQLRVEGFVSAQQASQISIGSEVIVRFPYDWLKQKEIPGKLVFVSPEANPVNLTVQVAVEIPSQNTGLSAGLRGDILIKPVR